MDIRTSEFCKVTHNSKAERLGRCQQWLKTMQNTLLLFFFVHMPRNTYATICSNCFSPSIQDSLHVQMSYAIL